jgi:hypothetical protein
MDAEVGDAYMKKLDLASKQLNKLIQFRRGQAQSLVKEHVFIYDADEVVAGG